MSHTYLRFALRTTFGVIASTTANSIFDQDESLAISGSLEDVALWNLRSGVLQGKLTVSSDFEQDRPHLLGETSILLLSPDKSTLAVGYTGGQIKLWSLKDKFCKLTLHGHHTAVTALTFNRSGTLLCSGSKDTSIILWDVIAESGLFKLHGHKDAITHVKFLENQRQIISSSKDTLLKIWQIDTQHCIQTVVGHRDEIWSFGISEDEQCLYTATGTDIRIYKLNSGEDIAFLGSVTRKAKGKVTQIDFNKDYNRLYVLSGKQIEIFSAHSQAEIKKKRKRREKRARQKESKSAGKTENLEKMDEDKMELDEKDESIIATDLISSLCIHRSKRKIRSFDVATSDKTLLSYFDNSLELYKFVKSTQDPVGLPFERVSSVDLPGHRSDVRSVSLSSDDSLLLSTSNGATKIWNIRSTSCLRTMESGYGLCGTFLPGDKYVLIGTKEGKIEIYTIAGGSKIDSVSGHEGAIWSIAVLPDHSGIVTGSADKTVKFWDFEVVQEGEFKRLGLTLSKTLQMTDDVLSVVVTQRFVAVTLLDNSIRVFFRDTLKFFVNLYGHKLPVMGIDISSDETLLVSGAADKNVKVWGLDFGDCHKSFLAHDESVMAVKFVQNTHYFFTVGKDKLLKYWDGDKFEHIMTLNGHHSEIWGLAVSGIGSFVVTASHDRSIRIWEQTEEQLFLEDERETEMENMFEESLENPLERGPQNTAESTAAGKRTLSTIKAGERILEAMEITQKEVQRISNEESDKPNALLGGLTPSEYLLSVVRGVRPSEMEEALMILPFGVVLNLIDYLQVWLVEGKEIELCCKCLFYLFRTHQFQMVTNQKIITLMEQLKDVTHKRVREYKDSIGYNRAALLSLKQSIKDNTISSDFI